MAALVLLSGGLDSTVAAALHQAAGHRLELGLFVDYGQRAVAREEHAAVAVGHALGFEVLRTALPLLGEVTSTALVNRRVALPEPALDELDRRAQETAAAVWVPNRNGVLIHLAAAVAEARGLTEVVVGFNAEEASTFPDNGPRFLAHVNASLAESTRGRVTVVAPVLEDDKATLLARGRAVGAPIELSWSCYAGGERPCGRCESCRRRERAERALAG